MIVAVTSWRGVGATTTALLIATAVAAHGSTWLLEADPAGGVLAGRIHLAPVALGGLERIAFPAESSTSPESFEAVAHRAGDLRIVGVPAEPFRAHSCHTPRLPWLPVLRDLQGTVVIDVGRARAGTPAWPIMALADVVLVVTSAEVSAAVATTEWLRAGGRVSAGDQSLEDTALRVVVVDAPGGVHFGRGALEAELAEHWAGWMPWEPAAVDLVHRGAHADDRRLRRSALMCAAREVGTRTARRMEVA